MSSPSLLCINCCNRMIEYSSPSSTTCQSCTDKITHAKEFLRKCKEKPRAKQVETSKSSSNIQIIINGVDLDLDLMQY